jgi:NAD(P)-dependent dehydrogenase (short-subunit alcohol dehydrogenase family)
MGIAVVTGASSGIGLATAVSLARAGHTVVATMRNLAAAGELRQIISNEKIPITFATLNVDDDASASSAFAKVISEHGHVDTLVNNAGIGGAGPIEEYPTELFRQIMETNFFGGLRCIKAVLPGMRERRSGCIVNVTSVAGRLALAPQAPYAASKWAFEALSECLAQEMRAFNVRVAIVEPGVIATPIFGKVRFEPRKDSPYPHWRRLRALFAASLTKPVSPYVVGEQIQKIVDGDTWQLRYPVGPDALPMLQLRASKTDEQVTLEASQSDEEFKARIKREAGLDVVL